MQEAYQAIWVGMIDARGIPAAACPLCGSKLLRITAEFDENYEIVRYLLNDAQCFECKSMVTAPTPIHL
jgi:hypothetical protein